MAPDILLNNSTKEEEHPVDAGGVRDVTTEAKRVKEAISQTGKSRCIIYIPSSAEIDTTIKYLNQIQFGRTIHFVPDFFVVTRSIIQVHRVLRLNSPVHRKDYDFQVDLYLLYNYYLMIFKLLKIQSTYTSCSSEIFDIIRSMENEGILRCQVPKNLDNWMSSVAKFDDNNTGRNGYSYIPKLQDIERNGDFYDRYFHDRNTAHLIPNFYILWLRVLLLNEEIESDVKGRRPFDNMFSGKPTNYAPLQIVNDLSQEIDKIPGGMIMGESFKSKNFGFVVKELVNKTSWNTDLERYLMYDPIVFRQLINYFSTTLLGVIDTRPLDQYINTTSSNVLVLFIEVEELPKLILRKPKPSRATGPPKRGKSDKSEPLESHAEEIGITNSIRKFDTNLSFKLGAKTDIVNGILDEVSLSPIVRIAREESFIEVNGVKGYIEYPDAFSNEINFESRITTIEEVYSTYLPRRS